MYMSIRDVMSPCGQAKREELQKSREGAIKKHRNGHCSTTVVKKKSDGKKQVTRIGFVKGRLKEIDCTDMWKRSCGTGANKKTVIVA